MKELIERFAEEQNNLEKEMAKLIHNWRETAQFVRQEGINNPTLLNSKFSYSNALKDCSYQLEEIIRK